MKQLAFEIRLPSIPWKKILTLPVALGACLLGASVYWWVAIRPFFHINGAILRAATLNLYAAGAGSFTAKTWEEGDLFQKGEQLASFQSESSTAQNKEIDAQRTLSQARLAREMVSLEEAMQAYIRAETEAKPSEFIDQILHRVQEAQQNIASVEAEIGEFSQAMDQTTHEQQVISAPFDGMILRTFKQQGQWAMAGEPIFSISEKSKLWIEASVPEERLGSLQKGMRGLVSFPSFPGRTWNAHISWISPLVESGSVKIRLSADELPLRPGLSANVCIKVR